MEARPLWALLASSQLAPTRPPSAPPQPSPVAHTPLKPPSLRLVTLMSPKSPLDWRLDTEPWWVKGTWPASTTFCSASEGGVERVQQSGGGVS